MGFDATNEIATYQPKDSTTLALLAAKNVVKWSITWQRGSELDQVIVITKLFIITFITIVIAVVILVVVVEVV